MKTLHRIRFTRTALAAALAALALNGPALAADAEVEALKETVRILQQEMAAMKRAQAASAPVAAAPAPGPVAATAPTLAKSFRIYGSLDSGVEYITHVGANESSLTRIPSTTGSGPTRVGLDFEHEVSPGIKGIARAEMGIFLDTGSSGQASRLFGRQAYVGIDTKFGSLTVGRQYSMLFHGLLGSDLLGPNIFGLGSIDAYVPNARSDNSVVWMGKFDKVSLGASYSFGRDNSTSVPQSGSCSGEQAGSSKCQMWSAMAKYDDPRFGVAAVIDRQYGGTGATASFFNGIAPVSFAVSDDKDTRLSVNGYAKLGQFKLGVGWLGRKVETQTVSLRQDTTWIQGAYPVTTQFVMDGGFFHVDNSDQNASANLYVLRGVYSFDPQLAAYASFGYMDNGDRGAYALSSGGSGASPVAGVSQGGTMVGLRYRF